MAAIFLNSLRLNWRSALFTGLGLAVVATLFLVYSNISRGN